MSAVPKPRYEWDRTEPVVAQPDIDRKPVERAVHAVPEPARIPAFPAYGGRPCFVCKAEGECKHREPAVAVAVLDSLRRASA